MNDKPQIKLSETVVLIDAAFLNFVITDIKNYFEKTLQRSLQEIDLSLFTSYLTLQESTKERTRCNFFLYMIKNRDTCNIASPPTCRRS